MTRWQRELQEQRVARTIDTASPSIPANLRAVSSSQSVALAWSASTRQRRGDRLRRLPRLRCRWMTAPPAAATSWTDERPGREHRCTATRSPRATRPATRARRATRSIRTLADTTAPSRRRELAGALSGFTVRLTWTASTDNVGVTGYTIYRGGVGHRHEHHADATPTPRPRSVETSSYTVRARDAAGNLSAASNRRQRHGACRPAPAPTTPGELQATVGAPARGRSRWRGTPRPTTSGVISYYLYRGNAKYKLLGKVTQLHRHRSHGRHEVHLQGLRDRRRGQLERFLGQREWRRRAEH